MIFNYRQSLYLCCTAFILLMVQCHAIAFAFPIETPHQWMWNTSHPYGVYTTTSITRKPQNGLFAGQDTLAYTIAGTSLVDAPQDPDEAELYALPGNGVPLWKYKGPNTQVTSARNGAMFAALAYDPQTKTGHVEKFVLGRSNSDWSFKLINAMPGADASVVFSDDGSTLSVAWYNFEKNVSTISSFHWNEPRNPIGKPDSQTTYEEESGIYLPINLCLSADGSVAAFHLGSEFRVVETSSGKLRWGTKLGYMDGVVDVSHDGTYVASGFETLVLWKWDASQREYNNVWTANPPTGAVIVEQVAISKGAEMVIGVAWTDGQYQQNFIRTHNAESSKPLVEYDYQQDSSQFQDVVSGVRLTDDGKYMVVGSWGDQSPHNFQVRVFRTHGSSENVEAAQFSTPGSVFAVDMMRVYEKSSKSSCLLVTAATKQVHANTRGRGGYFFAGCVQLDE